MHTLKKFTIAILVIAVSVNSSRLTRSDDEKAKSAPVPLNKNETVLLDKENGKLLLKATVCLREGLLEMLLCPAQSKEHESIFSLESKVAVVHAGLLALGAKPGEPAKFRPKYTPPQGQKIDIYVNWKDNDGKTHRRKAQELVRYATFRYFEEPLEEVPPGVVLDQGDDSLRYDKMNKLLLWFGPLTAKKRDELLKMSDNEEYQAAVRKIYEDSQSKQMQADFVFAGSGFSTDDNGNKIYEAEFGSAICVANFGDAMIDVDIRSSADNAAGRSFEPWTQRIPEVGTKVTIELIPVKENKQDEPEE